MEMRLEVSGSAPWCRGSFFLFFFPTERWPLAGLRVISITAHHQLRAGWVEELFPPLEVRSGDRDACMQVACPLGVKKFVRKKTMITNMPT